MEEQAKRKRGRFLVRMTNAPQKPPLALQADLQNAGCLVSRVDSVNGGFVIHCVTESAQQAVMGLGGFSLDGKKVKVSRMESQISVDDIGIFITEKLEIEHAFQESHRQLNTPREVREVSGPMNSPRQGSPQKGKGSYFGGKGSKSGTYHCLARGTPLPPGW